MIPDKLADLVDSDVADRVLKSLKYEGGVDLDPVESAPQKSEDVLCRGPRKAGEVDIGLVVPGGIFLGISEEAVSDDFSPSVAGDLTALDDSSHRHGLV